MLKKLFVLASLVAASSTVLAQDMEPPQELRKFEWLVGRWHGTTEMTIEGENMKSETWTEVSWEGQFLKMSTRYGPEMGDEMFEISYLGFDAKKGKFSMHTFTNFAATPRVEWGNSKDKDTWVFLSEPWEIMGTDYKSRATIDKMSANEFWLVIQFNMNGRWVKSGSAIMKRM